MAEGEDLRLLQEIRRPEVLDPAPAGSLRRALRPLGQPVLPRRRSLDHAGASHWAWYHTSATPPGQAHVSLNTPPIYVDIPASLQAVPAHREPRPAGRQRGGPRAGGHDRAAVPRVEAPRSTSTGSGPQGLCGQGPLRADGGQGLVGQRQGLPDVSIVDQPRNLWLGWGTSDYRRLDWACTRTCMTPEAIFAEYGLRVDTRKDKSAGYHPVRHAPHLGHDQRRIVSRAMAGPDGAGRSRSSTTGTASPMPPKRREAGRAVRAGRPRHVERDHRRQPVVQRPKFTPSTTGTIPYVPCSTRTSRACPTGRPSCTTSSSLHPREGRADHGRSAR